MLTPPTLSLSLSRRINDEILRVTAVAGGTLTVTRGQTDTKISVHNLGVSVFALSQVALEPVGVPAPATSFASHLILFTTGTCKGRWANITIYDAAEQCVSLGGTNMGGGYNWLDGKGGCTAGVGDKDLIKFGIDSTGAMNTSGAAGSLSTESWLTTVGTLQAHSDTCECVFIRVCVYVCMSVCMCIYHFSEAFGNFLQNPPVTQQPPP